MKKKKRKKSVDGWTWRDWDIAEYQHPDRNLVRINFNRGITTKQIYGEQIRVRLTIEEV